MKIVLLRHGEAEAIRSTDAERALTDKGFEQARATAAWLLQEMKGAGSVRILASPYRRAQETAGVVGEMLGLPVHTQNDITPDVDPRQALSALEKCIRSAEWVVVVSHMPLVAALSAWLTEATLHAGRGFMLAEAEVLEAEFLGPGTAVQCSRFIPGVVR